MKQESATASNSDVKTKFMLFFTKRMSELKCEGRLNHNFDKEKCFNANWNTLADTKLYPRFRSEVISSNLGLEYQIKIELWAKELGYVEEKEGRKEEEWYFGAADEESF